MKVYIAGGSGYIGTHLALELINKGFNVESIDIIKPKFYPSSSRFNFHCQDLSTPSGLIELRDLLKDSQSGDFFIHLAAKKSVAESVTNPELYFENNLAVTKNVINALKEFPEVNLIFSSSAAVYGEGSDTVSESSTTNPQNPYAEIKLLEEIAIQKARNDFQLNYLILRFFNVVGASRKELIEVEGENLFPVIINKFKHGESLKIFGQDYLTSDGTCVRDYIDVRDIVSAIISGIVHFNCVQNEILNLGTGIGVSVLEITDTFKEYIPLKTEIVGRRDGDCESLVANVDLAKIKLNWNPKYDIEDSIKSVLITSDIH